MFHLSLQNDQSTAFAASDLEFRKDVACNSGALDRHITAGARQSTGLMAMPLSMNEFFDNDSVEFVLRRWIRRHGHLVVLCLGNTLDIRLRDSGQIVAWRC